MVELKHESFLQVGRMTAMGLVWERIETRTLLA